MQDDLKELIESLKSHGVEFIVVGAHALAFHGHPRYTEDLDLFLRRSDENGEALNSALKSFGISVSSQNLNRLMTSDRYLVVIGHNPFAVDLMNFLDGVNFDDAWSNKVDGEVYGVKAWVISKEDYIRTKKASGRPKDLLDLEILGEQD